MPVWSHDLSDFGQLSKCEGFSPGISGQRFYLPPDDIQPQLRLVLRLEDGSTVPSRIIFDHELLIVRKGTGTWSGVQGSVDLSVGAVCFVRPFMLHTFAFDPGCDRIGVHFDLSLLIPGPTRNVSLRQPYDIRLTNRLTIQPFILLPTDAAWDQLLRDLDAVMTDNTPATRLHAHAGVLHLLADMLITDIAAGAGSQADEASLRMDETIDYLRLHLKRPLSLQDMAEVAYMGARQLSRIFMQRTGLPPMAYLRKLRVDRARVLLSTPALSIKQVAMEVGFDDPYHFSRVFHQAEGVSPLEYRRTCGGGADQ